MPIHPHFSENFCATLIFEFVTLSSFTIKHLTGIAINTISYQNNVVITIAGVKK